MHAVEEEGERDLTTRWTLQFRFKLLPWQPVARFTGVSRYTLDAQCRVLAQEEIRHPKPRPQPNRPTKQPRFGGWVRDVLRAYPSYVRRPAFAPPFPPRRIRTPNRDPAEIHVHVACTAPRP